MWDWIEEEKISEAFSQITLFEKIIIIFWTALPLLREFFGRNLFLNFENWMTKIIDATPAISYLGLNYVLDFSKLVNVLPWMVVSIIIIRFKYLKCALGWPDLPKKMIGAWVWQMLTALFALALMANIYSPIYSEVKSTVGGVTFVRSINITFIHQLQVVFLFFYSFRFLPIPIFTASPKLATSAAFAITVLVFAIAHDYTLAYVVTMMPMGAIYLLLMIWFGNIWVPIAAHCLLDIVPYIYFILLS